jgi:translocation and assembly module TamB
MTQPGIWLTGTLTGGKIKNYPLDSVDVDAVLDHNIITINKFSAKQGQGIVAIRGTADLNGPLDFEVGARGVDAGLLTAWFDTEIPTVGQLNFAAQVNGTAISPHAAVSLDIQGGAIANTSFDTLYGLLILDKGSIHVNQLMLTKGTYRASAYGVVPLAALSSKGREQSTIADQMNLKVRLDEANLSILPLLSKEVSWAAGPTKGEVTITGTLNEPQITGSIAVQDGAIKFASLANPIQKVGVDIQFEGDKINIKNFSGVMGEGSYTLSGTADLEGQSLKNYNLMLALDKLGIKHRYFTGPLSGLLTLTDTGRRPLLSGQLTFDNDTIDIPFLPEMAPSNLNLAFNVDLFVNNKVRFYNAYMYDVWATGHVKLAGSTRRPDSSGRIDAIRGTVSYLRTPFKITQGSVEFTQWRTFEPVIHLAAETKLQRTKINLNINGPVSTMDLKLTAEPSMSQQEILSLLTLRSSYKQSAGGNGQNAGGLGRDELIGLLDVGLQMRFISEVESAFRDAFGLDEFRLVRDTITATPSDKVQDNAVLNDREGYNLEFGKYLTDRLMLSYSMGLGHDEHSMTIRYDVTKRFSLTGEIDEKNHRRIGVETRFSF